jgi:septal ring factor EnvC (AmiA/AmiB activator)
MPSIKNTRTAGNATAKRTSKKVTLDDVWAIIAEIGEAHKELEKAHRETEQAIKETQAAHRETEQAIKETQAAHRETEQAIKETQAAHRKTEQAIERMSARVDRVSENVGGLNRSMGDLVEILVAAHLWEKFPEYDLQRAYRRLPLYDEQNIAKAEVDILLVNTKWAMAVEVKRQADAEDVKEHIERMERILKYPPAELKLRPDVKLLGALAGGIVTPEARAAAHNAGFFVLELAGESVIRVPEPAGFKPKEWTSPKGDAAS